jgi:hypothetical protein
MWSSALNMGSLAAYQSNMMIPACRKLKEKMWVTPATAKVDNPEAVRLYHEQVHAMNEDNKFIKDGPERPW